MPNYSALTLVNNKKDDHQIYNLTFNEFKIFTSANSAFEFSLMEKMIWNHKIFKFSSAPESISMKSLILIN